MNDGRQRACERFTATYGDQPEQVVRAPGRVNLIGEHTDHQDGLVLPVAVDRALWLAFTPRPGRRVEIVSGQARDAVTLDLDDLDGAAPEAGGAGRAESGSDSGPSPAPGSGRRLDGWGAYPQGVAWALRGHVPLHGWRGAIDSDIPSGAGLSSSAAIELACARAWVAAAGDAWDPTAMARLAQRAENHWVGVSSGIMDQLSCAMGRAGHALLIDCRSQGVTHIALPDDLAVVIMDTGTRRELTGSQYNVRQEECARAAAALGVDSLRDAERDAVEQLPEPLRQRARHVVTENERVLGTAAALRAGDTDRLARLLAEGHRSMRDDFEASGPALDAVVALASRAPGCRGARLTGAGFAGCAIALVERSEVDAFCSEVGNGYRRETGIEARLYVTAAADGVDLAAA